jgi:hypothetical protein
LKPVPTSLNTLARDLNATVDFFHGRHLSTESRELPNPKPEPTNRLNDANARSAFGLE